MSAGPEGGVRVGLPGVWDPAIPVGEGVQRPFRSLKHPVVITDSGSCVVYKLGYHVYSQIAVDGTRL
jgi:hypothetical protein